MKLIWTTISAAEDLGVSKRTLVRYLVELGIHPSRPESKRGSNRGGALHYILGVSDVERLREFHRSVSTGEHQRIQRGAYELRRRG